MRSFPMVLVIACLALVTFAPGSDGVTASVPGAGTVKEVRATSNPDWFLIIGDSISFDSSLVTKQKSGHNIWPYLLEEMLRSRGRPWSVEDTACPGETSWTYVGTCLLQSAVPLLASGVSQRDAALRTIRQHHTMPRFIVVELGTNDIYYQQRDNREILDSLHQFDANLSDILDQLAGVAPNVPLIVANIYDYLGNLSPDYLSPVELFDADIAAVVYRHQAWLADFYSAIEAPPHTRANFCKNIDCAHSDIHPTAQGHEQLARSVMDALRRAKVIA
ncbi:MAG TPA: SGNH/GDSL hydrolase family protein [Candidatus Sulfotelmatobacter sp.]|nr:SGNH/GDSL hydrolase family protein [Candidatus Sulfotelmatobacter sp.]